MTSAVSVTALHKRYPNVHALRGIDLEIRQGEFFGLLGPNGAGKSTLINVLAGLVKPSSGSAAVLGHDVQRDYRAARLSLGVVPQELLYDPFFRVREMLRLQAGYFGLGRNSHAWVDELMERLHLSDKADASLQSLSGGMKRRVLIAQALVHRPPVIVLDEPTAGVDVALRQGLWQLTRELHREGHTIILTTHYLEEAESLCDRIAVLAKGNVAALDRQSALIARHPWRIAQLSLELEQALPAALQPHVLRRDTRRVLLRVARSTDAEAQLCALVQELGLADLAMQIREPTLEEVFIELLDASTRTTEVAA
jgi:ABC-2 type transport system ATP-binding protein